MIIRSDTTHAGRPTVWVNNIGLHLLPKQIFQQWGITFEEFHGTVVGNLGLGPLILVSWVTKIQTQPCHTCSYNEITQHPTSRDN